MSKGELQSIIQGVGEYENLIDQNCKDKDLVALVKYLREDDVEEKILENQRIIKTPVVRNGKKATVGFQAEIWKNWE